MSACTDTCRERLGALRAQLDDVIRELDMESRVIDNDRELARRILGRWAAFDAAVKKAQEYMRVCGDRNLELLADEIDRVRMGIGGQP